VLESVIPKTITAMTLLEFVPQCCDASIYLKMGKQCAEQGICYNDLRPMGAVYWFSLPYRLGLPPASLIIAHYVLLAISVILSVIAGKDTCKKKSGVETSFLVLALFAIFSLAIHIVFLFPVLRTSLSDAPAALLALIGTWLLLLSPENSKTRTLAFGIGGLALGLAAWLRAFYLYPILLGIGLWLLFAPWKQKNTMAHLAILCAIIPILFQYLSTFNVHKKISYLGPETSSNWSMAHLDSTITGYDTILPFDYHTWYAPCDEYASIHEAIKTADIRSIACLLAGRMHFYLGSYSRHPYLPPFEHAQPEKIDTLFDLEPNGSNSSLQYINFVDKPLEKKALPDETGATITSLAKPLSKPQKNADAALILTTKLERGNTYRFEMMVWSDKDTHDIRLDLTDSSTKNIASSGALVTPTLHSTNHPMLSSVTAKIDKNDQFFITISSQILPENSWQMIGARSHGITEVNHGDFYIWDARLIKTAYHEPTSRYWSSFILITNLAVLLAAIIFYATFFSTKKPFLIIACLIPLMSLLLSLCIVPEQRFTIYPQIFIGWCALTFVLLKINKLPKYSLSST